MTQDPAVQPTPDELPIDHAVEAQQGDSVASSQSASSAPVPVSPQPEVPEQSKAGQLSIEHKVEALWHDFERRLGIEKEGE